MVFIMIIIIEKENLRLNEEWKKTPFEGLQYDIIKTGIFVILILKKNY